MAYPDNFKFDLVTDFPGYISSKDKTNLQEGVLVRGSQNVYKKISGTIASRFGLKRRGIADSTSAGVKSSFEYKSSLGLTLPIRVVNNKLEVESDVATPGTYVWYELLETSTLLNPARSLTRFVFDTWWEEYESKDRLCMVRGDEYILHWSGGITKVASGTSNGTPDSILTVSISAAGTGYEVGDILQIENGTGGTVRVDSINTATGAVTGVSLVTPGRNYAVGVSATTTVNSSASGCQINKLTIGTSASIVKSDTSTTWVQDGFANFHPDEHKIIINGVEYQYSDASDTTLYGVTTDASAIVADSIAIQSVFVGSPSATNDINDFIKVLNNQMLVGSYTSRILYLSASSTTVYGLGFLNYVNHGAHVTGDPDFVIIDEVANGIGIRSGSFLVSSGLSSWYEVTPNVLATIQFTDPSDSQARYALTKVQKLPGAGLSAAYAHEFISSVGDSVIYLSKDNQVRILGSFRNIFTTKYPSISQLVNDELYAEDFTGGHLITIGDFIYITAPNSGRDYMHQTREYIDSQGNITAERIWHPPQIRGISRFAEIDGIVYGHSNRNPQIYQIWDTNQWSDDSPEDEDLAYTCVARFSYKQIPENRVASSRFDKLFIEGYMSNGSNVYGNVYFDYNGSSGIQNVIVNTVLNPATFFYGNQLLGIGSSSLGDNPLGDGLNTEPNDQALLQKFRVICDINPIDSFEHQVEIYSNELYSRWEILAFGTNIVQSQSQPVSIRKTS